MKSMSLGSIPALFRASSAAATPRSEVFSPSAAICLALIPVRSVIHSSLVSMIQARSALVRILLGR